MTKFDTLLSIIEQLEKPNYQTEDGNHRLVDNAAFVQLKESGIPHIGEIIEDLKGISNKYMFVNQSCVIPKSVLDMYIEYLESNRT